MYHGVADQHETRGVPDLCKGSLGEIQVGPHTCGSQLCCLYSMRLLVENARFESPGELVLEEHNFVILHVVPLWIFCQRRC